MTAAFERICGSAGMLLASRIGLAAGAHHRHLFAFDERVGRVLDHPVAGAEAADDLHAGPIVLADDHRNQMRRRLPLTTMPTRIPSLRKISAAAGTMNVGAAGGVLKWTWASEPGISSPARLSTSISTSSVRLAGSMASAVRTSVPW